MSAHATILLNNGHQGVTVELYKDEVWLRVWIDDDDALFAPIELYLPADKAEYLGREICRLADRILANKERVEEMDG